MQATWLRIPSHSYPTFALSKQGGFPSTVAPDGCAVVVHREEGKGDLLSSYRSRRVGIGDGANGSNGLKTRSSGERGEGATKGQLRSMAFSQTSRRTPCFGVL